MAVSVSEKCRLGKVIPDSKPRGKYALLNPVVFTTVIVDTLVAVGGAVFIANFSPGVDSVTDLVLQLQQSGDQWTRTKTKTKTEYDRCAKPKLDRLGRGSVPAKKIEEQWNLNGNELFEKLEEVMDDTDPTGIAVIATPTNVLKHDAVVNWCFQMAALYDCTEIMIEAGIRCSGGPPPRCRVPAIVKKCLIYRPDFQ